MNTRILMIALPIFVILLMSACKNQEASNKIKISTGEFYFNPQSVQLEAGRKVSIELINEGQVAHEFMVGRGAQLNIQGPDNDMHKMHQVPKETMKTQETGHQHLENESQEEMHGAHAMSGGFQKDFFEGIDVTVQNENAAEFMRMPDHGTMILLQPHGKAVISFTVPKDRNGTWEMACFVPGHYEARMKGNIIVR
jgi:uncharacterized cupredoxin-like copper-binding protein